MAARYVLDTNLFIDAFRDPAENDALQRFHAAFAPYELFSAIVGHELRTGVRSVEDRRRVDRHVLAPFERRGRMIVPSYRAWMRAAEALVSLARHRFIASPAHPPACRDDGMLAA